MSEEKYLLSTTLHKIADRIWKVALLGPDNYRGHSLATI